MSQTAAAAQPAPHRRPLRTPIAAGLALIAIIAAAAAYLAIEGDFGDAAADIRHALSAVIQRYGAFGSLGLLYIEESGIPLPVPGDVYVTYLGHAAAGSVQRLLLSWAAIILVVTAGASNLYWISRRWGDRIINHPRAHVLHLDAHRMARAEQWFKRYGVMAMIFGRHIPGCRAPLTVVAGTLGFPYRLFVPSVMVSTAVWSGVFLLLGDRFGRGMAHFVAGHAWVYAAGTAVVLVVAGYLVFSAIRPAPTPAEHGANAASPISGGG